MHLSSRFTRIQVANLQRPGGPPTLRITITLNCVLEHSVTAHGPGPSAPQVGQLLVNALNSNAGGRRSLRQNVCDIAWTINWLNDPSAIFGGRALGVSLVPDRALGTKDGMFFASGPQGTRESGGDVYSRILLLGDVAARLVGRRPSPQARARFNNSAAHEVGHSFGASHQEGTLMDDTNTSDFSRRMTDEQLLEVIDRILPDGVLPRQDAPRR